MKRVQISLLFLSNIILILTSPVFSVDWYVRPSGGNYGSENGTSYTNAWDGLNNIVWGGSGVNPGDTLYICGTHIYKDDTGIWGTPTTINLVTGTIGHTITIRGDYPGDGGIVWGHIIPSHEPWVYEGNNTYSIRLAITTYNGWVLEDVNNDSYTLLIQASDASDCKNTAGSYYLTGTGVGDTLYVHCSDNDDPTDRIALSRNGWNFKYPNNASYIIMTDLKCYGHYRFVFSKGQNCSHLTWKNFILHISPGFDGFGIYDGNHYFTWDNCIIEYVKTGIYTVSGTDNAPSYLTIKDCTIRECGTSDHQAATGDYHALGIQAGHDILIENNNMYHCHEGIVYYLDEAMDFYNNICRYNYIHDFNTTGQASNRAIQYNKDSGLDFSGKRLTGNECYGNICVGSGQIGGRGISWGYPAVLDCYNNVIYNFDYAFRVGTDNPSVTGIGVNLKNNIFHTTGAYYIWCNFATFKPGEYAIVSDYNDFYGTSGNKWRLTDTTGTRNMDFAGWQVFSKSGCMFDPNSLTTDPKFTNASGSYSKDTDFQLQSTSPAIDKGIDVGLTQDYRGTQIPLGFAPDIGAYECVKPLYIKTEALPRLGDIPLNVNFTGDAKGDFPPFNFRWNFGDGTSSTIKNPSHTYSTEGNFTATLSVTDSQNNKETEFLYIKAYSPIKSLTMSSVTGYPSPGEGGTTDPSAGVHLYSREDSVQIKGQPYGNYRFSKWTGDISASGIFKRDTSIVMDKDKSISSFFCTKCGDVNGDLNITAADAQAAFEIFLKKIVNPTECQKENADVNCDGTETKPNITAADAQAIFEKFLGKNELPSNCSGNSRNESLSSQLNYTPGIHLVINNQEAKYGEEIMIPVIFDNPFFLKSFGFDLNFPPEAVEFITLERTDLLKDFVQVDANEIEMGVLRVGGYSEKTVSMKSQEIMLVLIFRAIDDIKSVNSFLITNTFDDIVNETERRKFPVYKKFISF